MKRYSLLSDNHMSRIVQTITEQKNNPDGCDTHTTVDIHTILLIIRWGNVQKYTTWFMIISNNVQKHSALCIMGSRDVQKHLTLMHHEISQCTKAYDLGHHKTRNCANTYDFCHHHPKVNRRWRAEFLYTHEYIGLSDAKKSKKRT